MAELNDRVGRVSAAPPGIFSGAIDRKGNHIAQVLGTQRQHDQAIHTQRHAGAVRQTGFKRFQQMSINRLLRQTARVALAVILLETLLLFARVGQLVETVRQLDAFEIPLKTLRHAVIFGADLRQ